MRWTTTNPIGEWYFFTYRATIWRVLPGNWMTDGLIAFAFEGKPQDTERFRNEPYWRERFSSAATGKRRFGWTNFYEAVAEKLLAYKDDRQALVKGIQRISLRVEGLGHLAEDKYAGGGTGFVKDICPFTTMGLFNRGIKDSNRKVIAAELVKLLGVEEAVPETFEGIPVLNNLKSWYFPFEVSREANHIDRLWTVFAAAIRFADRDDDEARLQFARAFDHVNGLPNVAWNLTFGLYWIRPWSFLSLDHKSQVYFTHKLGLRLASTVQRSDAMRQTTARRWTHWSGSSRSPLTRCTHIPNCPSKPGSIDPRRRNWPMAILAASTWTRPANPHSLWRQSFRTPLTTSLETVAFLRR